MGLSITFVIISVGILKVLVKRKSEYQVKGMTDVTTRITVLRDLQWVRINSENIVPGDVIALEEKTPVCCDCVLVDGRCVMDESSLTGEPTPVPKIPLAASAGDKPYSKHAQADLKYTLLAGTFIESTSPGTMASGHAAVPRTTSYPVLATQPNLVDIVGDDGLRKTKSTDLPMELTGADGKEEQQCPEGEEAINGTAVELSLLPALRDFSMKIRRSGEPARTRAVVLTTGVQTDQGQLIRGILFPAPLHFKFDQHWKLVFLTLLLYGLVLYVVVEALFAFAPIGFFYGIFTISQIMSPLIPAVFVAGQAKASSRLKQRNIFCVNLQRTFVAGKLSIFCFDKTGTLTKPGLEYYGVRVFEQGEGGYEREAADDEETNTAKRRVGDCSEPLSSTASGDGISEKPRSSVGGSRRVVESLCETIPDLSFDNEMIGDFLGCCHELDVVPRRGEDEGTATKNLTVATETSMQKVSVFCSWVMRGVASMWACLCRRRGGRKVEATRRGRDSDGTIAGRTESEYSGQPGGDRCGKGLSGGKGMEGKGIGGRGKEGSGSTDTKVPDA
eukprot:GHVS01049342.1.p1 GENE.GHVS01049342.1~~GHVS01049342.1.p1  ORF type:complete len:559 (-),score=93.02 GHVS01049342.1:146-1822(-)